MNKKEYLRLQKECAALLGESLKEYEKNNKEIKKTKFENSSKKDNAILSKLGLNNLDLKKRTA